MGRLGDALGGLRRRNRKALVIYLTAGYPSLDLSRQAALAAVRAGADVLEIGVPFSDPVADGPVIQHAMQQALEAGSGFGPALKLIHELRAKVSVPMVLFGYLNPLLARGMAMSLQEVAASGADGLLVVDVPLEESGFWRTSAHEHGLDWVSLVAPTTGAQRARRIAEAATGFIYLVSMTAVTGGALSSLEHLRPIMGELRGATSLPVCIGFGVRDKETARRAAAIADGVVVGTAVVEAITRGADAGDVGGAVGILVEELRRGIDEV